MWEGEESDTPAGVGAEGEGSGTGVGAGGEGEEAGPTDGAGVDGAGVKVVLAAGVGVFANTGIIVAEGLGTASSTDIASDGPEHPPSNMASIVQTLNRLMMDFGTFIIPPGRLCSVRVPFHDFRNVNVGPMMQRFPDTRIGHDPLQLKAFAQPAMALDHRRWVCRYRDGSTDKLAETSRQVLPRPRRG